LEREILDFINIFIHQIQSDTCSCIVELREAVNTCPDFFPRLDFFAGFSKIRAGQVHSAPFTVMNLKRRIAAKTY
jgi:hypothetical protein